MCADAQQARLEQIECKLAYVEDLVEQLNGVVTSQQRQLDAQQQRIARLRSQLKQGESQLARPEEEPLPPHY
ncbi:MAG: SlyX family protein [Mariprofundales bacterium]|nr:SlyX family protein [Mariprofundales bacterium]